MTVIHSNFTASRSKAKKDIILTTFADLSSAIFTTRIGKALLLLIILCFIVGCANTPQPESTLKVFTNQNTSLAQHHYRKAYLIPPRHDFLKISSKIANTLVSEGIKVQKVVREDFFAPQGTGFFITKNGYALTCKHVLGNRQLLTLLHDGGELNGHVLFTDPVLDLALLKFKTNQVVPYITFAPTSDRKLGTQIFALGYPLTGLLGVSPRLSQGILSAKVGFGDAPDQFQFTASIQPGNSGGPILNSQGQILGIAQSTLSAQHTHEYTGGVLPQNVNFAIANTSILNFLAQAVQEKAFPAEELQTVTYMQQSFKMSPIATPDKDFTLAEAASLLIPGPPLSQEDALVIDIMYSQDTQFSDLISAQSPPIKLNIVLYDFKSKTPLLKLEDSQLAQNQDSINRLLHTFFKTNQVTTEVVLELDQNKIQAVDVKSLWQLPKLLVPTTVDGQQIQADRQ